MSIIEIDVVEEQSRVQRWSHYLTLLIALIALLYAVNQRTGSLNATTLYENPEAGITLNYPHNWLIDETGSDYIFRVRDMNNVRFNTTIQINIQTIGDQSSAWNILTTRSLERAATLALYNQLSSVDDFILPDDSVGTQMDYTYAVTEINPALQSLPTIVIGRDILTIRGNQAIIITLIADSNEFNNALEVFNRFLNSLEFQ